MITYFDRVTLVRENGFYMTLLTAAVSDAAALVVGPDEDTGDAMYSKRLGWARKTLPDPADMARKMAFAVSGIDGVYEAVVASQKAFTEREEAKSDAKEAAEKADADAQAKADAVQPKIDAAKAVADTNDNVMLEAVKQLINGFVDA